LVGKIMLGHVDGYETVDYIVDGSLDIIDILFLSDWIISG